MKTLSCIIALVFAFNYGSGQSTQNFDKFKLGTPEECKAAEPLALKASTYVLSTPFEKKDLVRLQSLSFIMSWMDATPDYTFTIDEASTKICKGNTDLLGLYVSAMTKYCLENPSSAKDEKAVKLNAITYVLNYCENPKNNMKMTKELKKLSDAKSKGELEKEL
jgi:hypothetical protein